MNKNFWLKEHSPQESHLETSNGILNLCLQGNLFNELRANYQENFNFSKEYSAFVKTVNFSTGDKYFDFIDCIMIVSNYLNEKNCSSKLKRLLSCDKDSEAFEICGVSRNRNCCLKRKINLWSENKNLEGEIFGEEDIHSECRLRGSRLQSRHSDTSQTGGATFAECFFPPHSQYALVGVQRETHLPSGAVLRITVPAVQRVAKRESHSAPKEFTQLRFTTDGTCQRNWTDWIKVTKCGSTFTEGLPFISDYGAIDSAVHLDYANKDYVFDNLPTTFTLLVANGDYRNGNSVRYALFLTNMATLGDEIRSVNRVVRSEGKNISKLKKLFDPSATTAEHAASCRKLEDHKSFFSQSETITDQMHKSELNSSLSDCSVNRTDTQIDIENTAMKNLDDHTVDLNSASFTSNKRNNNVDSHSDIPFCRKVPKGSLWENVDISIKTGEKGLWNSVNSDLESSVDNAYELSNGSTSTSELHDLIAASRSELLKMRDQTITDKSNLESYFTSFENTKSNSFEISSSNVFPMDQHFFSSNTSSSYDCDINDMSFEDEEAALSDVSSDEELKGHPALSNTNYLPAYALHTIIEESCEESERDSLNATPTNNAETSKLERYFSWDIINDSELNMRRNEDDESTVYSDSLSEGSVGQSSKEVDPTQLVSSRLEKYFTSGLVDDQNYFYPDDAEYSEDPPISDFEEDSVNQKISRSALLSSLETNPVCSAACPVPNPQSSVLNEPCVKINLLANVPSNSLPTVPSTSEHYSDLDSCEGQMVSVCDKRDLSGSSDRNKNDNIVNFSVPVIKNSSLEGLVDVKKVEDLEKPSEINSSEEISEVVIHNKISGVQDLPDLNISSSLPIDVKNENVSVQLSNKQQITVDIQSIIQKLLSHFAVVSSDPLKGNIETDYRSAYQILESEVERLLNSISPSALEHSCNSSMVDSNNSDYGSDTIESVDCMTDDDECIESKNQMAVKCPLVDMLKSYKVQPECDLNAFNISDETLEIWRRLIQSLQKDNAVLAKNRTCDPSAEARLYIKNQIVTLMHTVTVNDSNVMEKDNLLNGQEKGDLLKEQVLSDEINEAYNVNVTESSIITLTNEDNTCSKIESSDEGISSTDSNENIHLVNDRREGSSDHQIFEDGSSKDEPISSLNDTQENATLNDFHSAIADRENLDNMQNKFHNRKGSCKENELKFNVIVDIKLDDEIPAVSDSQTSRSEVPAKKEGCLAETSQTEITVETTSEVQSIVEKASANAPSTASSSKQKDGSSSYRSCDDILIPSSSDFVDVPNFKSLKRSIKKFPPPSSILSKSTSNILQSFSTSDAKFSTLQSKSKKSKNSGQSPSRQFTSLFSPSSVFKRITGSKSSDDQPNESSIPAKYLKKYARSVSENENLVGAISMPHLNSTCKPGDSYSALGLYSENDPDNSLALDDEVDARRYFSGSQSVLSLGSHSASMTSVYSAGACHYNYVTVSGDVLFGLNYNQKSQTMEVFVKQCRNLASIDTRNNRSNPYVKVYLMPDKTRSGKRKTKTKKNTLNPVFNELLRFPVLKNELESRTLWLSVWNSDLFGRNDFLGEISLPLGYRLLDSPTLRWYPLQERAESLTSPLNYRGELFIALKYVPRDLSLESRFRPAPVISLRGALHILVKEARNISTSKTLDAFCKSYLLPDKSKSSKQKTPVVKKSRHPKWYYTVIYEDLSVDDLRERSLELTVWDHDKITSNQFMGGVRLNTGTGLYHGVSVEWMDARRDESSLWHAMLQSPNMWVDGCLPLRPTLQSHHS